VEEEMRQLEAAAQPPIEMPREELAQQQDQQPEDGELGKPGELLGKRGIEDIEGEALSEEEARRMQQRDIENEEDIQAQVQVQQSDVQPA
jgi:hypothetical protein